MCAIIGVASRDPVEGRAWLVAGRDALRHRGPDDSGEWWSADGCVGLAHRRLSIIDLTPAGHQPMHDGAGELCIVFNGEIYNFAELRSELEGKRHVFRSSSDTEVILAAYREWGTDCLERLNGMFAFALYDQRRRQLFLARDRAGEKPLFYAHANGAVRFASELKGLMADRTQPRRVDPEAMDCYLALGYVPGDRCMLQGVKKLPPAHALVLDLQNGKARTWRYWRPPMPDAAARDGRSDEVALLDELEVLFEDAVRRQLTAADVPVGVLLSGGVDSSLVTAMAARITPRIRTFTVRFPGHGQYDETQHARLIARHFGTTHMEFDAGECTVDLLPLLARQFDEPMIDSSMIPTYLVCKLARAHCTVVLGGDGGDELFGGYLHHRKLLWMQQKLRFVPGVIRRPVAHLAGAALPVGTWGRNWLMGQQVNLKAGLPLITFCFDRRTRQQLMAGIIDWPFAAERIWEERVPPTPDLLQRATRMDVENYLAEDILVKVDRASMLNSLEVRAPLLDYRLMEFALGKVPSRLKATSTDRKILLKNLAARVLPAEFDRKRKQGFTIPLGTWLESGPWQAFFRDVLLGSDAFFDRRTVRKLFEGQAKGRTNSERLFGLVLFNLWRREYDVSV